MSLISREDAIKALEDVGAMFPYRIPGKSETYDHYNEGWSDATDKAEQAIEALPDADDGWMPVEKRLPEEEQDVLICNEIGDIQLTCGSYSTETDGWIWYTSGWRFGPAIAWRPLPPAFKPKEDK